MGAINVVLGETWVYDGDHEVRSVEEDGDTTWIADVIDGQKERGRLIAAAPEMYRLLVHISECGSDFCQNRIAALLAKARGE